jgi:hypothetical protein
MTMRNLTGCALSWEPIHRREHYLLADTALIKRIGIGFIVIVQ